MNGEQDPRPRASSALDAVLRLRWPVALVLVAALAAAVAISVVGAFRSAARGGMAAVRALAGGFRTESVTLAFRDDLPRLDREGRGRLKVARLEAVETLRREDEQALLWGALPLGTTVTEIRVPVVTDFEVVLEPNAWRLELDGGVLVAHAPPLLPDLPPGLRTERMELRAEEGWLRFDGEAQLHAHLRELTPALERRARHRAGSRVVRDEAREGVADFVRGWLVGRGPDGASVRTIRVVFADEEPGATPEGAPPRAIGTTQ